MSFLVLHIFALVIFNQSLRYSQIHNAKLPVVVAVNYLIAAIANIIFLLISNSLSYTNFNWHIIAGGIINGLLYSLHMLVILKCYRTVGVGISSGVTSIGMIIPILAAWKIWNEPIGNFQWTAIMLAPIAIVLMRANQKQKVIWNWENDLFLLLNFILAGLISTTHKSISMFTAKNSYTLYQACLFSSASIFTTGYLSYQKISSSRSEILLGIITGIFNASATAFLMLALGVLLTAVVFPSAGCSIICLNLIIGWIFWKERLHIRQVIGVGLATVIILLINLG
jgi:drug/metabolite transporter (DMT)-like permease